MKNLQLAVRSLLKTPLVTIVAVLSLALGVGANAAIFSIFEETILSSLPVHEPDRLMNLTSPGPKPGSQSTGNAGGMETVFSYPMFRDLEKADTGFSGIAGHRSFTANLAYAGDTFNGTGMLVSGSYFDVLGLRPALGRLIARGDDVNPGGHPLAVLSHDYWTNRFGSSPDIVDKTLIVNGQTLTILGVAPPKFYGTTFGADPEVFVPLSMQSEMMSYFEGYLDRRTAYWVYLFGRLKDGVTVKQATAAINVPYSGILQEVELDLQTGLSDATLQRFAEKQIILEPGHQGQSNFQKGARTPLLLLLAITGFVLLIACANIANLLLVKAAQRTGEIAVRMSLGANRRQIVQQLLTESFLLAIAGSLAGLVVALILPRIIESLLPAAADFGTELSFGAPAWLFLGILTVVTGLTGLFPALHSTREDIVAMIKTQGGKSSGTRGANRFRTAMVTLQIALSMALLTSAGLFIRNLVNVSKVDLGLDTAQLSTFAVSPVLNGYSAAESRSFFLRVEEEIRAIGGVTGVVASRVPLISGSNWGSNVSVQGFDADLDTNTHSQFNEVGPGFFKITGTPLLTGEEFEERHTLDTPKVAIVNEAFARKFDLGTDVVGKRMQIGSGGELDIEIIGLAQDSKYSEVKQAPPPVFFLPHRQNEDIGFINFYVRASLPTEQLLPAIRRAVSAIDPNLPIEGLQTMEMQIQEQVFVDRILSILSTSFAILATLLAAVGLFGIMSYSVTRRTREIGLRMALGADARRIRELILRQVGGLTVVGGVVGILGALGIGRAARSLLFELDGHDPMVFGLSVLALVAIILAAGLLPAQRAAKVNPLEALAEE